MEIVLLLFYLAPLRTIFFARFLLNEQLSIPGIGDITVAKVLAYAGDVRRFSNAKALAAFIGVTPRQRLSGSSVNPSSSNSSQKTTISQLFCIY